MNGAARLMIGIYAGAWRLAWPFLMRRRRYVRDADMARQRRGDWRLPAAVTGATTRLWIHASSVGEFASLPPVIDALKSQANDAAIVASAFTDTGVDRARQIAGIDAVRALPADLQGPTSRVLDELRPDLVILTETELWPHLMMTSAERRIPVAIINGRLSERSLRRYARLDVLFRPILAGVTAIAAQSPGDRERYIELGARPEAVIVSGSSKVDVLPERPPVADPPLAAGRRVVTAGSIRASEFDVVLDAWKALEPPARAALCIVAPRHPDRTPALRAAAERRGLRVTCRTEVGGDVDQAVDRAARDGAQILILDTLGELGAAYARASLAVVGGGFVEERGHSILEAALAARAVLIGSRHVPIADEDVRLAAAGALFRCAGAGELALHIGVKLADPEGTRLRGVRARQTALAMRGAAERGVGFVLERMAVGRAEPVDAERTSC